VARNKRDFVEKMLPWVDAFRSAPTRVPAVTEKGLTMHKSFGSLLESVLAVFGKYGYKEFIPSKCFQLRISTVILQILLY
jgi:molecular chaperone GrpE (heat shock protein)